MSSARPKRNRPSGAAGSRPVRWTLAKVVSQRSHGADVLQLAKVLTRVFAHQEVIEPVTVSLRLQESLGPRSVYGPVAAS